MSIEMNMTSNTGIHYKDEKALYQDACSWFISSSQYFKKYLGDLASTPCHH